MGCHDINILGEGGNGLCKGMILSTLGVAVAPVLPLALVVTTGAAMPTMTSSMWFRGAIRAILNRGTKHHLINISPCHSLFFHPHCPCAPTTKITALSRSICISAVGILLDCSRCDKASSTLFPPDATTTTELNDLLDLCQPLLCYPALPPFDGGQSWRQAQQCCCCHHCSALLEVHDRSSAKLLSRWPSQEYLCSIHHAWNGTMSSVQSKEAVNGHSGGGQRRG